MTWQPTEDQLLCRDLQHSWSPYTAWTTEDGFTRRLLCDRCSATKDQRLTRDGYILSTSMVYPVGYVRPGEGRMTREERAELRVRNMK